MQTFKDFILTVVISLAFLGTLSLLSNGYVEEMQIAADEVTDAQKQEQLEAVQRHHMLNKLQDKAGRILAMGK